MKDEKAILEKLGIAELNPMQEEAGSAIRNNDAIILLSPTGTGKTLAFLLPVLDMLKVDLQEVQALILVPSRELAIQIEQVTREMGAGYKANAVYGGRAVSKDKEELAHPPAILIGTPGRIADHLRRETFAVSGIRTLILDEFDKSLEIGFEEEMKEIINSLPAVEKKIFTSATSALKIPRFANIQVPVTVNYLGTGNAELLIKILVSAERSKLPLLKELITNSGDTSGIIFCNFKDTISEVSDYLTANKIKHGCFHGGMEQKERERALIKFRNGTHRILLATDLAARGLDVPEVGFIAHYQLPLKKEEFVHRNGRTARMKKSGIAYVLKWEKEDLPDFIPNSSTGVTKNEFLLPEQEKPIGEWVTLFISGGRKDKISKGDIAGLFLKQGNLEKEELGDIELKQDCAFVSVSALKAKEIVQNLNNSRLKKKKVRIKKI